MVEALADAEAALRDPLRKPVFIILSVPPQFGKSTLVYSWLARLLGRYAHLTHAYCTYGAKLSEKQSRKCRRVANAAGIELDPTANALTGWYTPEGGGIAWTSIGGALTGDPISGIGVMDDPFKDRKEAESQAVREGVWSFYIDVFDTRCHPQASQIIIATRWHVDDLSGRLMREQPGKWRVINLAAITEEGESLWPEGRPLEFLLEQKAKRTDYEWYSLYMGQPRPKGGALFGLATTCKLEAVPTEGRTVIGIDLAYTKKTSADYSTAVVLRETGDKVYVAHALREQMLASEFVALLQQLSAQYPGAPLWWHGSTTEKGGADAIRDLGLPQLVPKLATADKFIRAQPVAAAWNHGRIIVPFNAPWSRELLDEVQNFTGVNDKRDDYVDALASAFSALDAPTGSGRSGRRKRFSDSLGHF